MVPKRLPDSVKAMLASRSMREHHALWHHVRSSWHLLTPQERDDFRQQGWEPPRLNPAQTPGAPGRDAGSGLDFLFMHRQMIAHVDAMLSQLPGNNYGKVTGWNPIPWDHADAEWPMPPDYEENGWKEAKQQQTTDRYRALTSERYESDTWLSGRSLDDVGAELENGIHNWLHVHWSSKPWYRPGGGLDADDVRNDYLGSTYSSHVNDAFWKLHGWIDDCIGRWERANNKAADFSSAWGGPGQHAVAKVGRSLVSASVMSLADDFFARQGQPWGALRKR